jgi:hypothetical protein
MVSSLQITSAVASIAHRVAAHDPDVARHPWLVGATAFCLKEIEALGPTSHAIELTFTLQLVDLVHDSQPEARRLLNRLGKLIPASGVIHVAGGAEDESMRPWTTLRCRIARLAPFSIRRSLTPNSGAWQIGNARTADGRLTSPTTPPRQSSSGVAT